MKLLKWFIDDVGDVENTKNNIIDTSIDIIEVDEPDPAIVDLKNRKESNIPP